jgi:hypothetical protein
MEAALKFKKYEYMAVWGDGGHTGKLGGAILPESRRWLWQSGPATSSVVIAKSDVKTPATLQAATEPTPAVQPNVYAPARPRLFQGRFRLFR